MPGRYSNDDPDSEADEESVDVSIDAGEYDESEYDESVRDDDEEEEEQPKRPRRRQSHSNSGGGNSRSLPRRSKSFQDDGITDRRIRRPDSKVRSSEGSTRGSRGLPRRSKTFDEKRSSARMPRRESSTLDKEAIASNRARRLRAMGDGGKGPVRLMRMSESLRVDSKKNLLEDSVSDHNEDEGGEEKKDEKPRERKPPRRSFSNDLAPEEQQYARTAARGVTRSRSLKAERPNLDKASKNVAARLGKLSSTTSERPKGMSGLKF